MTPDTLEVALRAVPLNDLEIYYPALAAAVRKWTREQLKDLEPNALAIFDVPRRLGL